MRDLRKLTLALLGTAFLCVTATAWAAAPPTATAWTPAALAAPAASSTAVSAADDLFTPQPLPATCTPSMTCTPCVYLGFPSSFQCTTFCVNGVPHRSCGSCGEGCNN